MFEELKVLELASVLAGPSVGQFFAELGATVIKVENSQTGGDVTRSWKGADEQTDDRSAYFCSVNWGKKSIALDLTSVEGKRIVQQLAAKSDIIIVSYKPGDAEKLGVAYQQLRINNEQLIYGQITGYGSNDPRVGYDAVIQAESGFMFMNGEPDGASLKLPVALIDILAGHQLKEALLLALLKRERTGEGSLVEVSLIQTAIASLANQATNFLVAGKIPQKQGSIHPNIAPYGEVFKTKDEKELLLAVGNDKQFRDLCKVLGKSQLAGDTLYKTNYVRVLNRILLGEELSVLISQQSSVTLLPQLQHLKIPAGLIHDISQALSTPQAAPLILSSNGLKGVSTFVGNFSGVDNKQTAMRLSAPPHLGEHTDEILKFID
ncbi:CoA transferase [Chryseotalea sanaruensis]|uniref:CoA transferase n=1 Tax=Chryseotalea sanaruensis TaxID=2482724 RepID=A0A401UEG2_9BACT|nr:CaiB/BaiF CoA-transferase family protein [Chryseotalea sanaruensis]GCC53283.1 CoA transferase [Chryseotalea sanaruensis]